MQRDWPVEIGTFPESRVRALGFDPSQLTAEEQTELIELYSACPDEVLEHGVAEEVEIG